jgi:hypothetical protein
MAAWLLVKVAHGKHRLATYSTSIIPSLHIGLLSRIVARGFSRVVFRRFRFRHKLSNAQFAGRSNTLVPERPL